MRAKISTTYHVDGGSNDLDCFELVDFDGPYDRDFDVPAGATVRYPLAIELAATVGFVIVAGCHLTLRLGNLERELQPSQGLTWTKPSGLECPLKQDTSEIEITSHSGEPAKLLVRVMEIAQPITVPVPESAPPVLTLQASST